MRIDQVVDPVSRQLVALRIVFEKTPGDRMIWLDGRPRPSPYVLHSWDGFSTGRFLDDTLEITTTHLKESYVRRNGVPASFRATVIEHISLQEPFLEWLLRDVVSRGIHGGRTYDAVIAACARTAGAQELLTLNRRHFDYVSGGMAIIDPMA